jgi:hypothetical protein
MNAPDINRSILRMHVAAIEAKHPIKILGILPPGSVGHMYDQDGALELLAEKTGPISLIGLAGAENDLKARIGRPVGIVLVTGLRGEEADEFPRIAEPV